MFFLLIRLSFLNLIGEMKNYLPYTSVLILAVCSFGSLIAEDVKSGEDSINPYGVCAHLSRWEFPEAKREVDLMREAGIGGFRCDLDWNKIEPEKGKFNFDFWDGLVDIAQSGGVDILSIIPGGTPRFAHPFPHHADELAESSAKIVEHFKGRITYWEIVNEPNHISFWGGLEPNAVEYRELLKKVYPAVKKANPSAKVLYGGLAGVPFDYMEETFKDGGANAFDIMNIHPYNWLGVQEGVLIPKIKKTRAMMEKYGVGDKPIWITEFGYTSAEENPSTQKYMRRALEKLGIDPTKATIGYLSDEKYNFFSDAFKGSVKRVFPDAKKYRRVDFNKLKTLNPEKCPVLFIGENEAFPYDHLEALYEYISKGGIVANSGGLPFYFDIKIGKDGNAKTVGGDRDKMKIFRLSAKSYNDPDMAFVKPMLSNVRGHRGDVVKKKSGAGFEDIKPDGHYNGRLYVSDAALGPEDKMIPFLYGVFGDREIPMGAIIKYGGDMKGAFIALFARGGENATEELQAQMLPREYILARSAGVERIYKYCFRDNERDYTRESHFGIIRRNLDPKPAYFAYKTLTQMLGRAVPKYEKINGVNTASWIRDDGVPVFAVWTHMYKRRVALEFDGQIKEIKDYLGKEVSYSAGDGRIVLSASGGVIYISGIKNVKISK